MGLCYYAWTQKNNFDRVYSKIEVVADDVVKLRLESESQAKRFDSDIANQQAGLQKLNQSHREQFEEIEEMEESVRALRTKIEELSQRVDEIEELKQLASQLQRLDARIKSVEVEQSSMGDIDLLRSRVDGLEEAIAALLSNALLN
jgi:polyhydroxyalkanoate synthesis regulator phasin